MISRAQVRVYWAVSCGSLVGILWLLATIPTTLRGRSSLDEFAFTLFDRMEGDPAVRNEAAREHWRLTRKSDFWYGWRVVLYENTNGWQIDVQQYPTYPLTGEGETPLRSWKITSEEGMIYEESLWKTLKFWEKGRGTA